jgi:hypothetical protein
MKITTVVLASVLAFFIQPTKADTAFDGNWWVTLDAKAFDNPDGSKARPWVIQFPATVKNGAFHGQYGIKGKPFWYELNGQIEAGSALFAPTSLPANRSTTLHYRKRHLQAKATLTRTKSLRISIADAERVIRPMPGPGFSPSLKIDRDVVP